MSRSIWLDCDPGHDDAFMIMLATHTPGFKVLGISTVGGNQTVDKTTINALSVLEAIGMGGKIDVVKGASVPLVKDAMICAEIHGESGLDCATPLPKPKHSPITDRPAIVVMAERIKKSYQETNEKVTIVATGCMTNVALLLSVYPDIKPMIEISILGGAITLGNMTAAAEFNILVDPESAHIVFNSGVPVIMVPLEVSHKVLVTKSIHDRVKSIDSTSKFIETACNLFTFFSSTYFDLFQMPDPPLHDPLAMAILIQPQIFTTKLMRVDVELNSKFCNGRTLCDVYNFSKDPKNITVATDIQVDKFWDLMINSLISCNKISSLNNNN